MVPQKFQKTKNYQSKGDWKEKKVKKQNVLKEILSREILFITSSNKIYSGICCYMHCRMCSLLLRYRKTKFIEQKDSVV